MSRLTVLSFRSVTKSKYATFKMKRALVTGLRRAPDKASIGNTRDTSVVRLPKLCFAGAVRSPEAPRRVGGWLSGTHAFVD